ncbi:MAG: hypothetical protein ACYCST_21015, partial [Acidimicrobiales bacterium]
YYTNSQSGLTSILDIPLWILPFHFALGFIAWLRLFIAAFGAYALARRFTLGFWPSLLAGISFGLCAFNIDWVGHQTLVASSCWLPWLVLMVDRVVCALRRADVALLAVAAGLVANGGHPGTEVQVMAAGLLYAIVRTCTLEDPNPTQRLWRLAAVVGGMVLGGALMAVVDWPVLLASRGTAGALAREGGGPTLPWSALKTALFPGWWGRPSEMNYGGPTNYVERTAYAGTIGLLFASLALARRSRWRQKLPLLLIGMLGLMVAFGVPVVHSVVVKLPLFSSVEDARMHFWFEFTVAMLAAFGLQSLLDAGRTPRTAWLVAGAGLLCAVVALIAVNPSLHDIRTTINHFRTGTQYHIPVILALTAIGWWGIFTVATLIVLWLGRQRIPPTAVAVCVVLLAGCDMFHFAYGFQPIGPASKVIPPTPPSAKFLEKRASEGRIVGLNGALTNDYAMNYGLSDVRGYDPPEPTERYFRLWQLANRAQSVAGEDLTIAKLTSGGLNAVSLLGARFIVAGPTEPTLALAGLSKIYASSDAVVYENHYAEPAAFVPSAILRVADQQALLNRVAARPLAPGREALVEPSTGVLTAGKGTANVGYAHDAEARVQTNLTRGGLVVLNDAWARGWTAEIDGRPTRVLRVDDVMRGVDVPAGRHVVVWRYRVPGLALGGVVSGLAGALIALLAAWPLLRSLRRRRRSRLSAGTPGPRPAW